MTTEPSLLLGLEGMPLGGKTDENVALLGLDEASFHDPAFSPCCLRKCITVHQHQRTGKMGKNKHEKGYLSLFSSKYRSL